MSSPAVLAEEIVAVSGPDHLAGVLMHGDEVVLRLPLLDEGKKGWEAAQVRLAEPNRVLNAAVRGSLCTFRPPGVDVVDGQVFIRAASVNSWQRDRDPAAMVVRIELFSNTDHYHADALADQIVAVVVPKPLAKEPADGSWVTGWGDGYETLRAFHRCDGNAETDPYRDRRRFPLRWYDVSGTKWIGWDKVLRRGADPAVQLQQLRIPSIARRPHVHKKP